MTATRIASFTVEGPVLNLFVSDCTCGVVFGIPVDLEKRRRADRKPFYCPNGHELYFQGKTDAQKLEEAKARETALRDQLSAAIRDGERTRQALLRDRQRFANGVCPCCNRSFENVRRHMTTQHPDYDVTKVKQVGAVRFRCSCGRSFESLRGLRTHQGHMRYDGWDQPGAGAWSAHLTKV
jgi:hypothetical protein